MIYHDEEGSGRKKPVRMQTSWCDALQHECGFQQYLIGFGLGPKGRRTIALLRSKEQFHGSGDHGMVPRQKFNVFAADGRTPVEGGGQFVVPEHGNGKCGFHERIETEFFDLETFRDRQEFFDKASAYLLWWNTVRQNTYKGFRSPDQILLEEHPDRNPALWFLPALDLDKLLTLRAASGAEGLNTPSGGYYVPALPGSVAQGFSPAPAMILTDAHAPRC